MGRRRPEDDYVEIMAMLRVSGLTAAALARGAKLSESTINKGIKRLLAGRAKAPLHALTMDKLRRAMMEMGYRDWLDGDWDLRLLTIAMRETMRALDLGRIENASAGAYLLRRIYNRLSRRPDMSDEAAEAVAETMAQELRAAVPGQEPQRGPE